ncbi:hypothetical protein ACFX2I_009304 [Malus domestica]
MDHISLEFKTVSSNCVSTPTIDVGTIDVCLSGRSGSSKEAPPSSPSKSRCKRRSDDSDSASYTESDDSDIRDSSPARSSRKRRERSNRRKSSPRKDSDDGSYDSDESEDRDRKTKRSSKNVTEEQIADYLARKAQKKADIEKVKKRREERALEKAQHEEEMALLARERARAEFQDWEKKEEEFHFDQSKVRSEIRLREGRIKPIDVLSKHLSGSDDFEIEIDEPYMVFMGLTVKEMEELRDDIKMHLDLDRATETHVKYWEALLVVYDWELAEGRKKDAIDRAKVRGEEPPSELLAEQRGLHTSVEADVKNLLEGKTFWELEELQSKIESEMCSGTAKVVEYWEAVLTRLHIFKAKACLKEIHAKMLHKHLQRLVKREGGEKNLDEVHDSQTEKGKSEPGVKDAQTFSMEEEIHVAEEEAGLFSPELLHVDENEEVINPEEDKAILEGKRVAMSMGDVVEGDAVFGMGSEVNLDSQVYWWHDKYRPRKPKYFNRVYIGYEWNKYNQTHYDHDNPPPKIVQGYKLNIFYPDLVDKTKAPHYMIEKDGDSSEICITRFHAGPPQEDMAFWIVNKEWEYSHKKGVKMHV